MNLIFLLQLTIQNTSQEFSNSLSNSQKILFSKINEELSFYYANSAPEILKNLRKDIVVLITKYDHLYKIFNTKKNTDNQLLLLIPDLFNGNLGSGLMYLNNLNEFKQFISKNTKYIYFTISEYSINAYNALLDLNIPVYYLEDNNTIFSTGYLPNIIKSIYDFLETQRSNFTYKKNNLELNVYNNKSYLYTANLKNIFYFHLTVLKSKDSFVEKVFRDLIDILGISKHFERKIYTENYVNNVIDYLYKNKYIFTKDLESNHLLLKALFPYKMTNYSQKYFSSNSVINGGISIVNVLNCKDLVGIVDYDMFRRLNKSADELFCFVMFK